MLDAMKIIGRWQPYLEGEGGGGTGGGSGDSGEGDSGDGGAGGQAQGKQGEGDTGEGETGEKKYTDADLDKILERKFAKWQKDAQKKIDEAAKLANMNAQEKDAYEKKRLEDKVAEYELKETRRGLMTQARVMLKEQGVSVGEEILEVLVGDTAEKTKEAVENFSKLFQEAVDAAVSEKLKGTPPKAGAGGAKAITKAEIMAIKDAAERRKKIQENIELFK